MTCLFLKKKNNKRKKERKKKVNDQYITKCPKMHSPLSGCFCASANHIRHKSWEAAGELSSAEQVFISQRTAPLPSAPDGMLRGDLRGGVAYLGLYACREESVVTGSEAGEASVSAQYDIIL